MYKAPAGYIGKFFYKLELILDQLSSGASIFLYVDFNIDFSNNSNNRNLLLSLLNSFGFKIHNSVPTRCTPYSSTMIDYCCLNVPDNHSQCLVINAGLSDHNAILCKFANSRLSVSVSLSDSAKKEEFLVKIILRNTLGYVTRRIGSLSCCFQTPYAAIIH